MKSMVRLMTIPGLDGGRRLENVRKESMSKAQRNLSRQTRSRMTRTMLMNLTQTVRHR